MNEEKKKVDIGEVAKPETKVEKKKVNVNDFINRKLKIINEMQDHAKAKGLAERVMKNRKEN